MSRWLQALGREDLQPKNHHRVCSQHFKASCFYAGLDRPCLRPDAVPTEFAGCCKARLTGGVKHGTSDPSSLMPSVVNLARGMATRSATKVQEKKAAQDTAEQAATPRATKDASTNKTSSLSKDVSSEVRTTDSEGQPLPKKRLFQLRHEAEGQAGSQAKENKHVSTSKPAHIDTGGPKIDNVINDVARSKSQVSDQASACCITPEESCAGGVVNRDLESGGPDPVLTATGALFLHTYCGERREPEQMVQLRQSLQAAKQRLALVERRLKRKTEAFAKLLSTNQELKFELSLAQRSEQQQFSVSERLPQDLLRDWHENAGRVPHARRYSPLTLRFAVELHNCSHTAYEHVARWLPMPTLRLVRHHSATAPSASRGSGRDAATIGTPDQRTDAATSAKLSSVPASRFASSVPHNRNPTNALAKRVMKPSALSPATFVAPVVKFDMAATIQGSSDAPAMFVISSAPMPEITVPTASVEVTPAIMKEMTPSTLIEITPVATAEAKTATTDNNVPASATQVAPVLTTGVATATVMETHDPTIEMAEAVKVTPAISTEATVSLPSIAASMPLPTMPV
ncbi:uncharacterized protein LOC144136185 isoform X2 [Amblyomma americanum]